MINVSDYIKIILKKQNLSNGDLTKRINDIVSKLGNKRTSPQNITNYLNGYNTITKKWLVKVEYALDLPLGTLLNMVIEPSSRESKKEIDELIKKVRGK